MYSSNVAYWKSRDGRDYRSVQEMRSSRGAGEYSSQMNWLRSYLEGRVARSPEQEIRLIDFGCGFGRVAHLCESIPSVRYNGFDFSETMVQSLMEEPPPSLRPQISNHVRVGDRVTDAFTGQSFDVALVISVLIHNDEAAAQSIIDDLVTLLAPGGEIILIENALVSKTAFVNQWHGGCWMHDFASYAKDRLSISIDTTSLPGHGIYRLWKPDEAPLLEIASNGTTKCYADLEQLHAEAALPPAFQDLEFEHSMMVAEILDLRERAAADRAHIAALEGDAARLGTEIVSLQSEITTLAAKNAELPHLVRQYQLGEDLRRSYWTMQEVLKQRLTPIADVTNGRIPEPPFIFDASQDTAYAHPINDVFKDVLTVCTQDWVGIRAASGSFPGAKLAVSQRHEWAAIDVRRVLDHINALGIKKIAVHGFSHGLAGLIVALRSCAPELRIYGVWHGALAAWCSDGEREFAHKFLSLADRGVYDRIHFLKLGMHVLHPKAFAPLLPNLVPSHREIRLRPAMSDRPITCLWAAWNNPWKNMYGNVVGAAACSEVAKVLTYAPASLDAPLGKKIRQVAYDSRSNHFALMSTSDLILNATVVDCHPMIELEGLAVGTPSIRSNLDLDFGRDHEYSRRFTLLTPHNPSAIADLIKVVANIEPVEVAEVVRDYRELVNRTSLERYAEFLGG